MAFLLFLVFPKAGIRVFLLCLCNFLTDKLLIIIFKILIADLV
jgi:hypothetical protein